MLCAYCGKSKTYPDDFPVLHYAKCKDCYKKEDETKGGIMKKINTKSPYLWLGLGMLLIALLIPILSLS